MSKIIKLDEAKKSKKIREKLTTEKQELELEIHILQKKLEVIQGFLDGTISASDDWHSKPPMPADEIKNLYELFMKSDYWKKEDELSLIHI